MDYFALTFYLLFCFFGMHYILYSHIQNKHYINGNILVSIYVMFYSTGKNINASTDSTVGSWFDSIPDDDSMVRAAP